MGNKAGAEHSFFEPTSKDLQLVFFGWALQTPYAYLLEKPSKVEKGDEQEVGHPDLGEPADWAQLPEEVRALIFARLPLLQLFELGLVSKSWRATTSPFFLSLCEKFCSFYVQQQVGDVDWSFKFHTLLRSVTFFNLHCSKVPCPALYQKFKESLGFFTDSELEPDADISFDIKLLSSFDKFTLHPPGVYSALAHLGEPHNPPEGSYPKVPKDTMRRYMKLVLDASSSCTMTFAERVEIVASRVSFSALALRVFKEMLPLYPFCTSRDENGNPTHDTELEDKISQCFENPEVWEKVWKQYRKSGNPDDVLTLSYVSPETVFDFPMTELITSCKTWCYHGFPHVLRHFLSSVRLPGESQSIDRIMENLSKSYWENWQQPTNTMKLRYNSTTLEISVSPVALKVKDIKDRLNHESFYLLSFALIMLSVDRLNPLPKWSMTVEEWSKNLRGMVDGGDFPVELLRDCYDTVSFLPFGTSI